MLFIDRTLPAIQDAKDIHLKNIVCRIRKRIAGEICSNNDCPICRSRTTRILDIPANLLEIVENADKVKKIIESKPEDHFNLAQAIWNNLIDGFSWDDYGKFLKVKNKKGPKSTEIEKSLFEKYNLYYIKLQQIFDYEGWFQNSGNQKRYDAYTLATNLSRNTCTYCNRLYTSTMKDKKGRKVMRPTFDHWYSKGKHPMLALSFYNLIPSCSVCNSSVKRDQNFHIDTHLHPYIDLDCLRNFRYSFAYSDSTQRFDIRIKPKPDQAKISTTYNDLKLKDMYNVHQAELADLIKIKKSYSEKYIDNLLKVHSQARLSHKEVYRLAFGVELEEKDFYKMPLSKFKKDILTELGLISFLESK